MVRRKSEPLDGKALLEYALRALSMRAMSVSELTVRLQRRAGQPADVEGVIEKLKKAGYLNDQRFAASYASARLENQGFGRMRVLRDLRQRRVAGEVAAQAVATTFEGTDEVALIEQYLARKYRGKVLPKFLSEDKNLVSAFRRLRGAGFSPGASIQVLKRYSAQAEALDGMDEENPEAQ